MAARTLRIGPAQVMTGDILVDKAYGVGGLVEDVVTWVAPVRDGNGASMWAITTVLHGRAVYAAQRRVTVKRSGPKGLGE